MENLIKYVGEKGKYQNKLIFKTGLVSIVAAMRTYSFIFLNSEPEFNCKHNNSILTNLTYKEKCDLISNNLSICEFDDTFYGTTIVTELGLICDKQYLASIPENFYMLTLFACFFGGYVCDRFGRKKPIIFSLIAYTFIMLTFQLLFSDMFSFESNTKFIIYASTQLLVGLSAFCIDDTANILLSESTSTNFRVRFVNIYCYFYIVGELIVLVVYFFSRSWRFLYWFMTIFSIFVTIVSFTLDESYEWLLSLGRTNKAIVIIDKISNENKKYNSNIEQLVGEIAIKKDDTNEFKKSLKQIRHFCWPIKSFSQTFILCIILFCINLSYYGTSLGITHFYSLNPYIMYLISSLAELIAYTICHINDYFGRKKTMITFFLLTTLMYFSISFLIWKSNGKELSIYSQEAICIFIFSFFGKCSISFLYQTTYIYNLEAYPANIRNTAIIFLGTFGDMGSLFYPQVNMLRYLVWAPLPYVFYGVSTFLSGILVCFLDETFKKSNQDYDQIKQYECEK